MWRTFKAGRLAPLHEKIKDVPFDSAKILSYYKAQLS